MSALRTVYCITKRTIKNMFTNIILSILIDYSCVHFVPYFSRIFVISKKYILIDHSVVPDMQICENGTPLM